MDPVKTKIFTSLLLCLISTANTHDFTLFENNQKSATQQHVSLNFKKHSSNNYALIIVIGIFVVCLIAFLINLLLTCYRGISSKQHVAIEMNTIQAQNAAFTNPCFNQYEQNNQTTQPNIRQLTFPMYNPYAQRPMHTPYTGDIYPSFQPNFSSRTYKQQETKIQMTKQFNEITTPILRPLQTNFNQITYNIPPQPNTFEDNTMASSTNHLDKKFYNSQWENDASLYPCDDLKKLQTWSNSN